MTSTLMMILLDLNSNSKNLFSKKKYILFIFKLINLKHRYLFFFLQIREARETTTNY